MDLSSRFLGRSLSALCISREAFRLFRTRQTSNCSVSSKTRMQKDALTLHARYVEDNSLNIPVEAECKKVNNDRRFAISLPVVRIDMLIIVGNIPIGKGVNRKKHISMFASDPTSGWSAKDDSSFQLVNMTMSRFTNQWDEFPLPSQFGKIRKPAHVKKPNFSQSYYAGAGTNYNSDFSKDFSKARTFDICWSESERSAAVLEPCVHTRNYESQNELGHKVERSSRSVLRPGMVLLKNYITHKEQVELVKICQKLGVGPGGFYRPGYKGGAKLHLQMMCLGMNWDPQRNCYEVIRSFDGSDIPPIPLRFRFLVHRALQDAHALIKKEYDITKAEDILPPISPSTCIVNFYSAATGKLGLHQDRSESRESLRKGLSVVSISVGDSAEFLYGDERNVYKVEKVMLESGDLLIFGGKSRHVFHGVSSIIPNSAPKELREETGLRPGRLNLTLREA